MKNLGLLIICILITACGKDVINEKSSFNIFEEQSIKFKASSEDTDNQIIILEKTIKNNMTDAYKVVLIGGSSVGKSSIFK